MCRSPQNIAEDDTGMWKLVNEKLGDASLEIRPQQWSIRMQTFVSIQPRWSATWPGAATSSSVPRIQCGDSLYMWDEAESVTLRCLRSPFVSCTMIPSRERMLHDTRAHLSTRDSLRCPRGAFLVSLSTTVITQTLVRTPPSLLRKTTF